MIPEDHEEQRIIRIARALCRSARIDPDAAIDEYTRPRLPACNDVGTVPLPANDVGTVPLPAWVAFRESARAFAARHPREIVSSL
jgi:hypothetical protein